MQLSISTYIQNHTGISSFRIGCTLFPILDVVVNEIRDGKICLGFLVFSGDDVLILVRFFDVAKEKIVSNN